jgi:hypothetical protein
VKTIKNAFYARGVAASANFVPPETGKSGLPRRGQGNEYLIGVISRQPK